jgi:hypothetical protein
MKRGTEKGTTLVRTLSVVKEEILAVDAFRIIVERFVYW